MHKAIAWGVHLLTVSGAGLALVAAVAAERQAWQTVFLCLGLALLVDGIDGPLARRARVSERVPWFDGAALDFVVDYTNYVFIPAYVIARNGLLPAPLDLTCGGLVAIAGALYFGDRRMKTADNGFRGFPAVWNAVVFLLMVYRPNTTLTIAILIACAILTFAPVEFVHPVRVARLRGLTIAITAAWGVLALMVLAADMEPGLAVRVGLLAASAYLAVIGFVLQLMRGRSFAGRPSG